MQRIIACLIVGAAVLACESSLPIWQPVLSGADPLFRFVQGSSAGFIDASGRVVVRPVLPVEGNSEQAFYGGLLVLRDGRVLDQSGRVLAKPPGLTMSPYSEGLAPAFDRAGDNFGYVDKSGRFVIAPQFQAAERFSEGMALVESEGRVGYIGADGNSRIEPQYAAGLAFQGGFAAVIEKGGCVYGKPDHWDPCLQWPYIAPPKPAGTSQLGICEWSIIDRSGKRIEGGFEGLLSFREGLAAARRKGVWGFVDGSGQFVIQPQFQRVESFSDGLALVELRDGRGYIDKTGKVVLRMPGERLSSFSEGRAVVWDEMGQHRFIDRTGELALPGRFVAAAGFRNGLAHVKLSGNYYSTGGEYAYIDRSGKVVFRYTQN